MKMFERFFMGASGLTLLIVFLVSFVQVIQRYLFSMSIPWATDVIRVFFIYSVFSGMCVGVIRKKHLDIDVLVQLLPPKGRRVLSVVSNLIVITFLGAVLRYSISFIESNADQTTPYLLYPMSYVYAIFPLTIVVMIAALLLDTRNTLFGKKGEGA